MDCDNRMLEALLNSEEARLKFLEENIPHMALSNDVFLTHFMILFPECVDLLISGLLNIDFPGADTVTAQFVTGGIGIRSARFDLRIIAKDASLWEFDVENIDSRAKGLRLTLYSAHLTTGALSPGQDFDELPPRYVLIATKGDVHKTGKPIYYVRRCIVESPEEPGNDIRFFDDKELIVYVNNAYGLDGTLRSRLMHDLFCHDTDEMLVQELKEKVEWVKNSEKGRMIMAQSVQGTATITREMLEYIFDESRRATDRLEGWHDGRDAGWRDGRDAGWRDGRDAGWRDGRDATQRDIVLRALSMGLDVNTIAAINAISAEKVEEIRSANIED